MAYTKISDLSALTTSDGAEELLINDGGTSKKITIANATASKLNLSGGTLTGNIDHDDGVRARYGDDNDLQIFHVDGSNSYIENVGEGDLIIQDSGGDVRIKGKSNEDSIVANNDGSVDLYYDNNLKLNTTSYGAYVSNELRAANDLSVGAITDNATRTITVQSSDKSYFQAKTQNDNENSALMFGNATNAYDGRVEYVDRTMRLYTATSERMRIDSSGNVGIGHTTPQFGLTLPQGTGASNKIGWEDAGNTKRASITCSSSTDALQFHTGSSDAERMRIDSSGNVGIGCTPSSLLHLQKTATTGATPIEVLRLEVADNNNVNLSWEEGPAIHFYVAEDSSLSQLAGRIATVRKTATDIDGGGHMTFSTATDDASLVEAMRIDHAGNVGIGTTSPAQELDISSANPAVRLTDTTTSGLYHDLVSYGNDLRFSADGGNVEGSTNIEFFIDGSERMRILSSGGITFNGDTSSDNALDDYETGTFTASYGGVTNDGTYVKIGSLVSVSVTLSQDADAFDTISGFPFAASRNGCLAVARGNGSSPSVHTLGFAVGGSATITVTNNVGTATDITTSGTVRIDLSGTYPTNS
jgi:hypothetical protein